MTKLKEISDTANHVAVKVKGKAAIAAHETKKAAAKAVKLSKPVLNKSIELYKSSLSESPSTTALSKVGFWSGLASLPFGFPANVIAVVSGVAVEDRRRLAAKSGYKRAVVALVAPKAGELLRSRVGLAAGGVSLAITIVGIIVIAKKKAAKDAAKQAVVEVEEEKLT